MWQHFVDEDVWDNDDEERLSILADMRQLKCMATFFLHPEAPIKSSGMESARCYYDRYSFPFDANEANEREEILADTAALKLLAGHFLHPETSVVTTDPCACGRNFFTRFDAPDQDAADDERDDILEDAMKLKENAMYFLHPEIKMNSSVACARNIFTRLSGPHEYDATIRDEILQDVANLRKSASDYLHPERPVAVTDPTVFGRNWFMRYSAPTPESMDDFKIRQQVLEDANAFQQFAADYLHPELPLIIYATSTGRNYFSRGSGTEYESLGDVQARNEVMADVKLFKELAKDFLHPELPVVVYGTTTGRNYFSRPSAEEIESLDDTKERDRIMADAKASKQSATHFLHPEYPVVTSDGTVCGRNYFSRFSAPVYDAQVERERDLVLDDAKALRQAALDFMHPEIPMRTSIGCARNYYARASAAPTVLDPQELAEREQCLAEARALKKLAVDYLHPERPVQSNVPCTRSVFDRPSSKLHDTMIHTFPAHDEDEDDNSDQHHHEHIDHFGLMDEEMEMYHDLRAELEAYPAMDSANANRSAPTKYGNTISKADSEVGSNLSRSPSSVFLFGMDDAAYE